MPKSFEEMRDERDQIVAEAAIEMVATKGGKPAIAMDDDDRTEKMLARIEKLAKRKNMEYTLERINPGVKVHFEKGWIYIFPADKMAQELGMMPKPN